jgi:fructose-1,6-bisphosphatase/inositol monophosphatase family enzyme
VDPIDGTENFTSGLPEWGISVSCYLGGVHSGSLIGCPEIGHWIMTGETITRHRSRIRGLSSSLSKEEILEATQGFEYRISGCCVYNMMSVIRGSFLSFENPKGVWSWDILGGLNLALEHGLKVELENKPYAGEYLTPDRRYRFKVENR